MLRAEVQQRLERLAGEMGAVRKNLVAIGNSLGVVIERPILDLLGIGRDTQLNISADGRRLILEPPSQKGDSSWDDGVPGSTPQDFGDPGTSVCLVDALVSRFHLSNRLFRRLHRARNYDNTFKAHRDLCAKRPAASSLAERMT